LFVVVVLLARKKKERKGKERKRERRENRRENSIQKQFKADLPLSKPNLAIEVLLWRKCNSSYRILYVEA